jgi:hypothetical protein
MFDPGISTPAVRHHRPNSCVRIAIAPSPRSGDANNIFELSTLCLRGTRALAVCCPIINTVLHLPAAPAPRLALVPSVQALLLVSHLPWAATHLSALQQLYHTPSPNGTNILTYPIRLSLVTIAPQLRMSLMTKTTPSRNTITIPWHLNDRLARTITQTSTFTLGGFCPIRAQVLAVTIQISMLQSPKSHELIILT